jgi:hypothetical protein
MKKQTHNPVSYCLIVIVLLFALSSCSNSQQSAVPPEMVGTWVGLGHHLLAAEFLDQKQIPFMLIIGQNGELTGYIGDATIQKTSLQSSAWWLKLIGREKFRSKVLLRGNIVNKEGFSREGGTLFFNKFTADEIICNFTSIGSQVDANNMVLPIRDITLRHPE